MLHDALATHFVQSNPAFAVVRVDKCFWMDNVLVWLFYHLFLSNAALQQQFVKAIHTVRVEFVNVYPELCFHSQEMSVSQLSLGLHVSQIESFLYENEHSIMCF